MNITTENTNTETEARASWSGKWAFILAAAASAVGLGNLWRFPYLAAKYGGGTFLCIYFILVFTFGVSLLLLEIALGRYTGQSTIGAFKAFGKKYAIIGIFASSIPFIITCYYCVIGGWVTKYMASYVAGMSAAIAEAPADFFTGFITSPVESFIWMYVFMLFVFVTVGLGVKGGIEKANLVMMPLLIVIAIGVAIYTLTMPGALEGAAYYLAPNFSKLGPETFIAALGQMFFSLSLAMGIMVTYGSYLDKKNSLTQSVARIGSFDIGVSFLAGLTIVPAAFVALGSGEAVAENSGPSLMFVILPSVFDDMGMWGAGIGMLFFVLVLFAALTSAISLAETMVSIIMDGAHWSRRRALIATYIFLFVMGTFINLGYNGFSFIEPMGAGTTLLDFFDFIANSVMMPIAALATCIFVGWIIKPNDLIAEIKRSSPFRGAKAWTIMIKFIAPVLVTIILIAFVAAQLGMFSM